MKVNLNVAVLDDDGSEFRDLVGIAEVLSVLARAGVSQKIAVNVANGLVQYLPDQNEAAVTLTVKEAVRRALKAPDAEDHETFDERIELAIRIIQAGDGEVELDPKKDVELILARVKKFHNFPVVHYRVNQLLTAAKADHQKALDAKKAAPKTNLPARAKTEATAAVSG